MEICPLAGAADLPIEASLTKQHLMICKMLLHLWVQTLYFHQHMDA